uniref:DNA/RNA non-specific endonuclease/pyrophosphatase/phosphodiesterase domain-containing protein n=1 Tax=Paramormyrops kingsleyae TaxID=1676925 RepID=A0A3B3R532_9TELE
MLLQHLKRGAYAPMHIVLSGTLFLVLVTWCSSCVVDVQEFSMHPCFFYSASPFKGLPGITICQRYLIQPWLAAYVFSMPAGKRPQKEWQFEPQLAYCKADGNVLPLSPIRVWWIARLCHLDYTRSTFTLTNVVPQKVKANDGSWAALEKWVSHLSTNCEGEAHIVMGAVPHREEKWLMGHRIGFPESLWSAYSCLNYIKNLPGILAPFPPLLPLATMIQTAQRKLFL